MIIGVHLYRATCVLSEGEKRVRKSRPFEGGDSTTALNVAFPIPIRIQISAAIVLRISSTITRSRPIPAITRWRTIAH